MMMKQPSSTDTTSTVREGTLGYTPEHSEVVTPMGAGQAKVDNSGQRSERDGNWLSVCFNFGSGRKGKLGLVT